MKFNYQIRTKEGEIQAGVIEASSKEAALRLLQRSGFFVTYLEEARPPIYAKRIEILERISRKDIVLFFRQLSIMFGSNISLVEALRTIAKQTKKFTFREIIFDLANEIEGGSSFSKALSRHPKVFSNFFIAMIRAGERAGKMADVLNYLADYLETTYHLESKIKGALIYPIFVLIVMLVVLVVIFFFVVPTLTRVFSATGAELPMVTKIVIAFTKFLVKYWLYLLSGILIIFGGLIRYYQTNAGKKFFDRIFLKLPILGSFLKTIYLSRFSENLSILISSGLMISQALELVASTIGNSFYQKAILEIRNDVRKGASISSVLSFYPEIFPPVFAQMVLVGERAGTLGNSLSSISQFYQKEISREIDNLISLLEPILIIFLGLIVGVVILSVLIPLYQIIGTV